MAPLGQLGTLTLPLGSSTPYLARPTQTWVLFVVFCLLCPSLALGDPTSPVWPPTPQREPSSFSRRHSDYVPLLFPILPSLETLAGLLPTRGRQADRGRCWRPE